MRRAKGGQRALVFHSVTLKETENFYDRYRAIDSVLDTTPEILACIDADLQEVLDRTNRQRDRECRYTSENVLRLALCQMIEGASLREIVVRVDDSNFLRTFCRFGDGPVMSYALFCTLRNAIQPETWQEVNRLLGQHAMQTGKITGDALRLDTTACETNIHYPTDSGLLYDTYRVFDRLIKKARKIDPSLAATGRRLHIKAAKRHYTRISRAAGKNTKTERLKPSYEALLSLVEGILTLGEEVIRALRERFEHRSFDPDTASASLQLMNVLEELEHYHALGSKVVDQTRRRVVDGEKVPNEEKIFSIFEPHTELLKRGKAGKPIEFGHMVLFAQTQEKFITDFEVYEEKPVEHTLVDGVVERHVELFGATPATLAADKGFYESPGQLESLRQEIEVVAIGKKGKRTAEEEALEHSLAFKLGQAFRSGIEGTISYVKRCLRLYRCFAKGWQHYAATVSATIVAHNLLILARGGG